MYKKILIVIAIVWVIALSYSLYSTNKRIDRMNQREQTQTEFNNQILDILKVGE